MTQPRVGVAVIGVGAMGRVHAANAALHVPAASLVAVYDADGAVSETVARELGAAAASTLDELVARDDVRVVVVASPSRFHAEHAIAALEHGKDVLLEKPMAHSLAECDRILAATSRAKARLQLGFMRRYDPAYAEAKRLIGAGDLGEPRFFRAVHRDREVRPRPASVGVRDMMLESTIHDFDLARFLLADEIATVATTAAALCHDGGPHDHAPSAALNAITLRGGALGDVETYWGAQYAYDVRTEIICAKGTAMIGHQQRTRLDIYRDGRGSHELFTDWRERFRDAYLAELIDFVAGVAERRPPAVSGHDGRAAVAAALAGIAAYASGRAEPVA